MEAVSEFPADRIRDGMVHALSGGKRLRGYLVLESAALHGVPGASAIWAAAAVEAVHAYSLVHDDLPAMDNDDMRRGHPTVHVQWDEATAILVGDALQALAFELVALGPPPDEVKLALSLSLARVAGGRELVRGQAMDIAAEVADTPLPLSEIESLQDGKTGALIVWSCAAGPVLAGKDPSIMVRFARCLGRAFQIADDILDVAGDESRTGKRLRKDEGMGKATFVSHLGLSGAREKARELVDEAMAALAECGDGAEPLREAARFVISREF
ncbi:MAG: polyprenyl synthetase family protein [Boseongicola sp.]|nr:polyprenyl synthetase family protein [Boseongicola sp.]